MRKIYLSDIIDSAIIAEDVTVVLYDKHDKLIIKCDADELGQLGNVIKQCEVISLDIGGWQNTQTNRCSNIIIGLNMSVRLLDAIDVEEIEVLKKRLG